MEATEGDLARRAAKRLIGLDAKLPEMVEARLRYDGAPSRERYDAGLLIALAGLVLEISKFAWEIYEDRRKQSANPDREGISRRVRLEVELPAGVSESQRDTVIAAVVAELPAR